MSQQANRHRPGAERAIPSSAARTIRSCNLRRRLTSLERQRLRELGQTVSLAVEATCRNFDPGEREADVAGHLAHRLIREGVDPGGPATSPATTDSPVIASQLSRPAPIRKRATIAVTGRRHGLCASVTRTVAFGTIDAEFRTHHSLATMVDATCIFFSRPGEQSSPRSSAAPSGSMKSLTIPTNGRSTTRAA